MNSLSIHVNDNASTYFNELYKTWLSQGKPIRRRVSAVEMTHFRFISNDPSKSISIQLNAISSSYSMASLSAAEDHSQLRIESDVELYVTNRGDG